MEQQTVSKLGKEYIKAVYCHPAYLTYMQNTSCGMPEWMKHKLESRLPGKISVTPYADDTTLMAESKEELESILMKVKEESEKPGILAYTHTHTHIHIYIALSFSLHIYTLCAHQ